MSKWRVVIGIVLAHGEIMACGMLCGVFAALTVMALFAGHMDAVLVGTLVTLVYAVCVVGWVRNALTKR